jgi:hypothetical protein
MLTSLALKNKCEILTKRCFQFQLHNILKLIFHIIKLSVELGKDGTKTSYLVT